MVIESPQNRHAALLKTQL